MTPEAQRIAIAEACRWRKWQFGDPFLDGLRLADQKFDGYIRTITRVYSDGVLLDVDDSPLYSFERIQRDFLPTNFWLNSSGRWWPSLPDYLGNLNAMHEAERTLSFSQQSIYTVILFDVVNRTKDRNYIADFSLLHATAAQRAEAFLRTIGAWDDTK